MTREELIAALERAEGPSRELDAEIAPYGEWVFAKNVIHLGFGGSRNAWVKTDGSGEWQLEPPAFTFSIDAAITLVPKEWEWGVRLRPHGDGQAGIGRKWESGSDSTRAATPAIALCLAALKARAA